MPFRSESQHRKFRAMESRSEIPKGTSSRWASHTPGGIKSLPERVRKKKGGKVHKAYMKGKKHGSC